MSRQVRARPHVLDGHPCPASRVVGHFSTIMADNTIWRSPVSGNAVRSRACGIPDGLALRHGSERLLNLVVSRALFGTQGPAWTSPPCPSSSTSSSRAPEPDTSTCRGSQPPAGAGRHLRSAHPKHLVNQNAMPLLPDQLLRRSVVWNLQPENGSPLTAPDALPCPEMPSPPPAWSRYVMPEARPPRTNRPATPSPLPTSAPMPRNP